MTRRVIRTRADLRAYLARAGGGEAKPCEVRPLAHSPERCGCSGCVDYLADVLKRSTQEGGDS